jgi:lysophospholipase L1-like esterase
VKAFKKAFSILLLAVFLMAAAVPAASAGPRSIDYVALGDSIAAGVIQGVEGSYPVNGSDKGYPHLLAAKLEDAGFKVEFNHDLCIAGMTAAGLAEASTLFGDNELFQNADLVTLDVGANDLLGDFYAFIGDHQEIITQNPDPVLAAELAVILQNTVNDLYNGQTGKDVQGNIEMILNNILDANPKAKIYVMGYYNPLPALKEVYNTDLTMPVIYFNTFIYRAICNVRLQRKGAWISYVDTVSAMSNGLEKGYLTATDIHPTVDGHEMIAKLFWQRIKLDRLLSKLM